MAGRTRTLTLEAACEKIATKLRKAGQKGAGSPVTPKTSPDNRLAYEKALAQMEAEGKISAVRGGTKPRFFLREFAPSRETAAVKIERMAAAKHPVLLSIADFKKALATHEKSLLSEAVQWLDDARRLVRLVRGKAFVFAHADSLRAALQQNRGTLESAPEEIDAEKVWAAYRALAVRTGFPAVEIAALQRESGAGMTALKTWLLGEHRKGRAVFGLGDWSLADETTRAGAVELRGDRHLLVRLEAHP